MWYVATYYKDIFGKNINTKKRRFENRELAKRYEASFMLSDKISQQNITFEQLCDNFINYKTTQLKA